MGIFHFLNVLEGDCSVIQHPSGRVTVADVNNARGIAGASRSFIAKALMMERLTRTTRAGGNYGQAKHPVDPIDYLERHGITSVHRFVLTHPDMDHMGGIKPFFERFRPINFWDTNNLEEKDFEGTGGKYSEEDWVFYKGIRDENPQENPKRLVLYDGACGQYFNQGDSSGSGSDGLHILAPTPALEKAAQNSGDCNAYSYVLLYRSHGGRILLSGDSHDETWEHILENHLEDVANVDVLLAPHHGRDSDRDYAFLDAVRPKLTLFGNAASEYLGYEAWRRRGLRYITNNQANCIVINTDTAPMSVYVTNERFARDCNPSTMYDTRMRAWFLCTL